MTDSLVARVAAVMDDTTLVLNAGSQMGVKEGMLFDVVAQHQEITDPNTGEGLGQWEVAKARVVVTHVQEKMSTVRTPLTAQAETSGTLSTLMVRHSFGLYGEREDNRDALDVRTSDMAGRPAVKPIEVGDLARRVRLADLTESAEQHATDKPETGGSALDLPSKTYDTLHESGESTQGAETQPPADDQPSAA
jgi:hypothetical protein